MSESHIDIIKRKRAELHEKRKKKTKLRDIPGRVRSKQVDDYVFPDHVLEGANVTVTDNGDGTVTIAATQLTVEEVQDIVAAFITAGIGIKSTYDDPSDTYTLELDFTEFSLDDIQAGTTNKHFTSTLESKLAGIESGATADQTDAEIETAYNNQVGAGVEADITSPTSTIKRWAGDILKAAIEALSINSLSEDTTPQLGGDLDGQSLYDLINIVTAEFEGLVQAKGGIQTLGASINLGNGNISNVGDFRVDSIRAKSTGSWLIIEGGGGNSVFYVGDTGLDHFMDINSGKSFVMRDSSNVKLHAFTDAGDFSIGHLLPDTRLDLDGAFTIRELSADPADPDEGSMVTWMSDGTGSGDDGDILRKITAGGVTKTVTVHDFSTL